MTLHVQPTVPMRLVATSMALPMDLAPTGQRGRELDNDAVHEAVLGPDWRAVKLARDTLGRSSRAGHAPPVVQRRQWVQGDATAIELGVEAARRALAAAGMSAGDLAALVCVSSTPPLISAAMAARIGVALGCNETLCNACCFDVRAGGVGVMLAWFTAQGLIAQGGGSVLIVAAETASVFMRPGDLGTAMLYADGAAACILARDDDAVAAQTSGPERFGFLGGMSGQMRLPGLPTTIPGLLPPKGGVADVHAYRFQKPDRVHLQSLHALWGAFPKELAAAFPQACAALKHFLPYPISLEQMTLAHEAMGQPASALFHRLPETGCLGAASPLASLHGLLQSGTARRGEVLALASAAGNGLWAGLFWRLA
ncbi:MAG: hypothetical protein QM742_19600 [Aquabacterium sp.]